ncbi:uncharacterized protein Hap1MRO34_018227 [Clarias gariepinus]|uniref:uncharacterized protein si:ch73-248e21.5 n=1 Tax=Clarias gariepinus TaxID=13013 RepID=UPI00234D7AD7|nr:uncharacterized protein si:ch73-248e21.5 [Clarias gariepinus]
MMKSSAVSLSVWFVQVLTLCTLHESLLTAQETDVSITVSENPTANHNVQTTTTTAAVMTTPVSAAEAPTLELSKFTSPVQNERRNVTISVSQQHITRLTETTVSENTTSVLTEYQETGTVTESTSINVQKMAAISTSGTATQSDHDVQTSMSWTGDGPSDSEEANTTTVPLVHSTYKTDATLTSGSYPTTDHQSPTPATTETWSYPEILSTNRTPFDDTMKTVTPTGTSGQINSTAMQGGSTQTTSSSTENTEEPLVSSTKTMEWTTQENTEEPLVSTNSTRMMAWTTQGNTEEPLMSTNSTRMMAWITQENTEEPLMSTNSTKTMEWTTQENTEEPLVSTNSTKTMEWTTKENTEEPLVSTNSTKTMEWTTQNNTEEPLVSASKMIEWTTEPLVSSTEMMAWTTQETTEAQATSHVTIYDIANTTWRDTTWSTNTEGLWSSNSTTSKNITTSETETPDWTNCFANSSSQTRRFSNLVCFITIWSLAMIASIFLGLSVFLWVRLSVRKKRARIRGRERKDGKGHRPAAKEKQSLWAERGSSAEERVEFWYANGDVVEEGKRRQRARQVRTRMNKERQAGAEEDAWIQPKVTLKDITEFWHMKERGRHEEETQCEVNEE